MPKRKRPGLYQRGGVFHIRIYPNGEEISGSLETTDQAKAEEAYDKIRSKAWDVKHLERKPEPVWEDAALAYVEKFDRLVKEGKRRAYSLDRGRLKALTEELTGKPLSQISRKSVISLLEDETGQFGKSALISAVLNVAAEEGMITAAPRVKHGAIGERNRYLSNDEARKLLSQAGYLHDAVLFSLATGLRQANALRLRWDWIKDRTVIVPASEFKQKRDHAQPLNRTAMACISRQLDRHPKFVFVRHDGEPFWVNYHQGGKSWEHDWIKARMGIDDFRWHDLRHSWASWSVQAGVPEAIVETLGGWQSGKMVRRYAHASVEFLRPYAEQIDGLLASVSHTGRTSSSQVAG